MGYLALAYMLLAVFAGVRTFLFAKATWRLPALLNAPGAFFIGGAVFLLTAWSSDGLFSSPYRVEAPAVPWYSWLEFIGMATGWYGMVVLLLKAWHEVLTETASNTKK